MKYTSECGTAVASSLSLALNPSSHFRMFERDLREMRSQKLLNAPAYISFIVRIHSAAEWKWSFQIKEFCQVWNIPERTFYRAISKLKTLGLLHWKAQDTFTVWYHTNTPATATATATDSASIDTLPVTEAKPSVAEPMPSVAEGLSSVAEELSRMAEQTPESLDTSESRHSSDSSQIFKNQTNNRTVAGEKNLTEEKEVDSTPGAVAEPPVEVDKAIDEVTEPSIIEPPSTPLPVSAIEEVTEPPIVENPPATLPTLEEVTEPPIVENPPATLPTLEEVTEPPIIEIHPASLPTLEESPQVEPSIPNVDNAPAPSPNIDTTIKSNSSTANSLDADETLEEEEVEKKVEPTSEEVREVLQHLRGLGITLNYTIQAIVKKHYASVNGAIAHLKERINSGERFGNLAGAFVKACKEGAKPENKRSLGGIPQETNPPSREHLALLEAARKAGKIWDYFLSSDGVCKVVLNDMLTQKAWWEYLGVAATD